VRGALRVVHSDRNVRVEAVVAARLLHLMFVHLPMHAEVRQELILAATHVQLLPVRVLLDIFAFPPQGEHASRLPILA